MGGISKFARSSPAHTQAYWCWLNMRIRCKYPSSPDYVYYGARGIGVCPLWDGSFEDFVRDFGLPPAPGLTIDRIKNHLGYYKGNCRWATNTEQQRNKRNNLMITYAGTTMCASAWSELLGGNSQLVRNRLWVGWTPEQAVSIPMGTRRPK